MRIFLIQQNNYLFIYFNINHKIPMDKHIYMTNAIEIRFDSQVQSDTGDLLRRQCINRSV